jgi:hypothetical protein
MYREGFEVIQGTANQFKPHFNLFLDEEITLKQLEEVCFSWIIKNEYLYGAKPIPTEPMQYPHTSMVDFKRVVQAWRLACDSMKMENKSNAWWLEKAKEFFLKSENDYDEGIKLFEKYKEPEELGEVPF